MEMWPNGLTFFLALLLLCLPPMLMAVALVGLLQLGRPNALKVSKQVEGGKDVRVEGIPFYIKRSRLLHKTTYLETIATYKLAASKITLDGQGKPLKTEMIYARSKIVSWTDAVAAKIAEIHRKLAEIEQEPDLNQQLAQWNHIRQLFEGLEAYSGETPTGPLPLVENMISEEVCVDYSTPYFLNAPQPLIGSSDISTELSADGTLSKTTVKIEDSTFEKLLDVLPAGKLVESITGLTGKPTPVEDVQAAKPAGQIRYEFDITAKEHYIRHTLFQEVERRDFRSPISPSDDKSWYRREFVAGLQPEETEQETTPPSGDTEADE